MAKNTAEWFKEIESMIRNGKLQSAKKELNLFSKSKKLSPLDRSNLALFHIRLGQVNKALHSLNKELAPSEFGQASIEELCEQATLAHILNQIGAQKYALRLLDKINEATTSRKLRLHTVLPQLDRFMGNIYFGSYDYKKALPFYQSVVERIDDPTSYQYKLSKIGVADAKEGLGLSDDAIKIVSDILDSANDNERLLKGICYQARSEYYIKRAKKGDLKSARQDIEMARTFFDEKVDTKDFAFLNKWSGILNFIEGNEELAQKELEASLQTLLTGKNRPTTYFEVFYWLERMPNFQASLGNKLALRAHPLPSPFGLLSGKHDKLNAKLHPWIQKIFKERRSNDIHNCWYINDGEITAANYADLYQENLLDNAEEVVDLFSCIYIQDDGSIKTISENQAQALISIIGSGSLGISQWSLIDIIYGQSFYDPLSGIERINKTIEQLRKNGFQIIRKKNQYFFADDQGYSIIIPSDIAIKGVHEHFKLEHKTFKRKEIEEVYGIKKATANIWVKNWEEDGVVVKYGVGKSSYYEFK